MQEENQNKNKEGVVGPIVGSVIIILLIVLGGLYFWSFLIQKRADVSEIKTQESLEEDVQNLEEEIKNEDLDTINSELEQIEKELDTELNMLDTELNTEIELE